MNASEPSRLYSVMLVDDHQEIIKYITALVDGTGIARVVASASNGADALERAALYRPDLIMLDVMLLETTGFTIARKLARATPRTRILAVSSYSSTKFVQGMLSAGASGYLLKKDAYDEAKNVIEMLMKGGQWLSQGVSDNRRGDGAKTDRQTGNFCKLNDSLSN